MKNNSGKKYVKLMGAEKICKTREGEVQKFNEWFAINQEELTAFLHSRKEVNLDILHETYIAIRQAIAFKKLDIRDYKAYFIRAYFINLQAEEWSNAKRERANVRIFPEVEEPDLEISEELQEILEWVAKRYPKRKYLIFQSYILSTQTYSDIAAQHALSSGRVGVIILNILKDLKENCRQIQALNYLYKKRMQ